MANQSKPKQTSTLSFFENRSSVMVITMKRKLMSTVLILRMNAKVKRVCSEPQFEELLSVALQR